MVVETNDGEAMKWTFQAPQEILVGLYEIGLEEWVLGNYGTINAFLVEAEHDLASSRNYAVNRASQILPHQRLPFRRGMCTSSIQPHLACDSTVHVNLCTGDVSRFLRCGVHNRIGDV